MMTDAAALVGFGLLVAGVWMLSPAWALIVAGSLLLTGAVAGTIGWPHDDE